MAKGMKTSKGIDRFLAVSKSNSEKGVWVGVGTMLGRNIFVIDETNVQGFTY